MLEEINEEPSYREGNSNNRISLVSQNNILMQESKGDTPHKIHQKMIGCDVED
jgi:hypothetical protein